MNLAIQKTATILFQRWNISQHLPQHLCSLALYFESTCELSHVDLMSNSQESWILESDIFGVLKGNELNHVHFKANKPLHRNPFSLSVTWLCLTLWSPVDCSSPGSSVHGDSPGKNTGVGCHTLLLGIFPTQGSNPHLLCCQEGSLVPPGKPHKFFSEPYRSLQQSTFHSLGKMF